MRHAFVGLAALLVVGSPAWAAASMAAPASSRYGSMAMTDHAEKAVETGIKSVDRAGGTLTLSDGLTLKIPANFSAEMLKPGELVTATYQKQRKGLVLTGIWIETGPLTPSM